jgi:hypothetical protein
LVGTARLAAAIQQIQNCCLAAWTELLNDHVGTPDAANKIAARCNVSHIANSIAARLNSSLVALECWAHYGKTVIEAKSPGAVPGDIEPK